MAYIILLYVYSGDNCFAICRCGPKYIFDGKRFRTKEFDELNESFIITQDFNVFFFLHLWIGMLNIFVRKTMRREVTQTKAEGSGNGNPACICETTGAISSSESKLLMLLLRIIIIIIINFVLC